MNEDNPVVKGGWEEAAACKNHPEPDLWFAEEAESPTAPRTSQFKREMDIRTQRAKAVCRGCPVRLECLEAAIMSPTMLFGVWGGQTRDERKSKRGHAGAKRAARYTR